MDKLTKLAEGKTKIIYRDPADPSTIYMVFKDDITAGDGLKHDVIEGKALIDWQTNRDIFEYLNRAGVRTHYLESPQEKVSLVKRLDRKINLEIVTRRVAAGSIVKWGNVAEGAWHNPVITQFHYKDDPLHDPMLEDAYVDYIIQAKGGNEYAQMRELNASPPPSRRSICPFWRATRRSEIRIRHHRRRGSRHRRDHRRLVPSVALSPRTSQPRSTQRLG
jgi:phosphoribosylaminoimidazole-succinocarboxamide synthase